jgi:translocation and assembly module TamB
VFLFFVASLGLLSIDFWAPALILRLVGVEHGRSVTAWGQARTWEEVVWRGAGVRLEARRLRVDAPSLWLRRGRGDVELSGWTLVIERGPTESQADTASAAVDSETWRRWVPRVRDWGQRLETWVGEWALREGRVVVGGQVWEVPEVKLRGASLEGRAEAREQNFAVTANLRDTSGRIVWREADVELAGRISPERAEASLAWLGNSAAIEMDFAAERWAPAAVRVEGVAWRVPAVRLGLGELYEDPILGFSLVGEGETLFLRLQADAAPRVEGAPRVRADIEAELSPQRVRLERLDLVSPSASAGLSAPVEWTRAGGWDAKGEPNFVWQADLEGLSGGKVSGVARGTARLAQAGEAWRLQWALEAEKLAWRDFSGIGLTLRGESMSGATRVSVGEIRGTEGSRIELQGGVSHADGRLDAVVLRGEWTGADLAPWLPADAALRRFRADLRAEGGWREPELTGWVEVEEAEMKGWAAERVRVEGSGGPGGRWNGVLTAKARDQFSALRLDAELDGETARISGWSWRRADGVELSNPSPADVSWADGAESVALELTGPAGERVRLEWESGENVRAELGMISPHEWLEPWRVEPSLPELKVERLAVDGGLDAGGLVRGTGELAVEWAREGRRLWLRAAGALDGGGLVLGQLHAGTEGQLLLEGAGVIPWRLRMRGGTVPLVELVDGARWEFDLESRAGSDWWEALAEALDLEVQDPAIKLSVRGEAKTPDGRAHLGAKRIVLKREGLPAEGVRVEDLAADLEFASDALVLPRLVAAVDGQAIHATGRLPWDEGMWEGLRKAPWDWVRDHAEGSLRLPDAELAAVARYMPTILAPQGKVRAELALTRGTGLDGVLEIDGAATRPLGSLGVFQEIEAELRLAGMEVRIERLRARSGGQELVVSGGARRQPGKQPALDLTVRADRFPLLRRPGLLVRGDLDLRVVTDDAGRTGVGGEVRLRESLFLADVRPLITRRSGTNLPSAQNRPPFFSVERPPLAEWELRLRVAGDGFLRLRTPIFEGVGSATFDLSGTLLAPRAVGEFRVERGNVLFPFATLAVREGAVRLAPADPFTMNLDFRASGRRLGYELQMELTGTAENPRLQLSSSPPLDAEDLLLMVTAGAVPGQASGGGSASRRLAAVGAYVSRDLLRTLGLGSTDEDRLTISTGEKVSRQGRETYEFDFRLNENWSLTGEYDEFDAYNVGVRRSFGPSAGEPDSADPEAGKGGGDEP